MTFRVSDMLRRLLASAAALGTCFGVATPLASFCKGVAGFSQNRFHAYKVGCRLVTRLSLQMPDTPDGLICCRTLRCNSKCFCV